MDADDPIFGTDVSVDARPADAPHPWYGPCDGFWPDGSCSECARTQFASKDAWEAALRRPAHGLGVRYAPTREDVMDVFRAAANEGQRSVHGPLRATLENILTRVYHEGLRAESECIAKGEPA